MSFAKEDLGQLLRDLRQRAGLTQTAAARVAGIDISNLSKYEGGRDVPKLATLTRLLDVYGVDLMQALRSASGQQGENGGVGEADEKDPNRPLTQEEVESGVAEIRSDIREKLERIRREAERLEDELKSAEQSVTLR